MKTLRNYQKDVLAYCETRNRLALFLEMRLGKSLIAIRWTQKKNLKKILLVCPKSVIPTWCDELKEENYNLQNEVCLLLGSTIKKLSTIENDQRLWVITNYETFIHAPEILKEDWECLILDESTRIKNPNPQITKTLINNTKHINNKVLLTGCPDPEGMENYFTQMIFLYDSFMGCDNFWHWRNKYFFQAGYKYIIGNRNKQKMINELSQKCLFLSRKDAHIEREKIYEKRYVFMSNARQRKLYTDIATKFLSEYKDKTFSTKFIPVQLEWLSQIASGFTPGGEDFLSDSKHKEILDLLTGELKNEKVIIWFKHNCELISVSNFLNKRKISSGLYYGDDKSGEKLFKANRVRVLCIQQKCGQYGLNLSQASTAIYYSTWWSSELRMQSEDRILDVSKKDSLLIIDLIAKYTIDEDILKCVTTKALNHRVLLEEIKERITKHLKHIGGK